MDDRYSEEQLERAFDTIRKWNASQLEERVRLEMGREVMGLLGALAKNGYPSASEEELSKTIHLMVLSFLLRAELEK